MARPRKPSHARVPPQPDIGLHELPGRYKLRPRELAAYLQISVAMVEGRARHPSPATLPPLHRDEHGPYWRVDETRDWLALHPDACAKFPRRVVEKLRPGAAAFTHIPLAQLPPDVRLTTSVVAMYLNQNASTTLARRVHHRDPSLKWQREGYRHFVLAADLQAFVAPKTRRARKPTAQPVVPPEECRFPSAGKTSPAFRPVTLGAVSVVALTDAAEMLATRWPIAARGSEPHRTAMLAAKDAFTGAGSIEAARVALILAAQDAGLAVTT